MLTADCLVVIFDCYVEIISCFLGLSSYLTENTVLVIFLLLTVSSALSHTSQRTLVIVQTCHMNEMLCVCVCVCVYVYVLECNVCLYACVCNIMYVCVLKYVD